MVASYSATITPPRPPLCISSQDHRLALSGHIPGQDFPYSDHEGVEATFELCQRDVPVPVKERIFDGKKNLIYSVSDAVMY